MFGKAYKNSLWHVHKQLFSAKLYRVDYENSLYLVWKRFNPIPSSIMETTFILKGLWKQLTHKYLYDKHFFNKCLIKMFIYMERCRSTTLHVIEFHGFYFLAAVHHNIIECLPVLLMAFKVIIDNWDIQNKQHK